MVGIGNSIAVAALVTFINTVYAMPWRQDVNALFLPGIVGGVIGYSIGAKIGQARRLYWLALTTGGVASLVFSLLYNEVLLKMPMKPAMYEVYLYTCFLLMNMAAFSVFGILGWNLAGEHGERRDTE